MSRYVITCPTPGLSVTVGWDPPLGTFFAQVKRTGHIPLVMWVGTKIREIERLDNLVALLKPYVALTEEEQQQLRADQERDGYRPNLGTQILYCLNATKGDG